MIPTLVIESCTERAIVAIVEDGQISFQSELPFGYNSSKLLIPNLYEALQEKKMRIHDFGLIAVGVGPGSYTGIRVGAVIAKTLAYTAKVPLVGVSTLEGFIPNKDGLFAAVVDAKIGGVYILTGNKEKGKVTYLSQPEVCGFDILQEKLKKIDIFVTPHSEVLKAKFNIYFPEQKWEWQERAPDPLQLALSAFQKYQLGMVSLDGHLEMLYLRKTQAEIEKAAEKQKKSG